MFHMLLGIASALSTGATIAAAADVYTCLQAPDQLAPKLECSDFEAGRIFLAIEKQLQTGRIEDGLALLEMLAKAKPFQSAFRVALVENKLKFNRLQGIVEHVNLLNKLDPNSEAIHLLTARTLDSLDRREEAITLLSKYIQSHSGSMEIRRLRAQILEKVGKWQLAQTDWHILERTKPLTEERMHRVLASLKEKSFETVRAEVEPLLKAQEAAIDLRYADLLAQAYFGLERYSDAEEWGKRILEKTPENHEARVRLAKALIAEKKYEEAVLHLTRILGVQANHLGATYHLAKVRILQDRYDLAGQVLGRLAQLERHNAWTVKAQAELWNHLGETALAQATLIAGALDPYSINPAEAANETKGEDTEGPRDPASTIPACVEHLVQRGETLESIAQRYFQNRQAWSSILAVNSIGDPHRIREGMVLWIPKDKETGKCGE